MLNFHFFLSPCRFSLLKNPIYIWGVFYKHELTRIIHGVLRGTLTAN